ncbi:MAG: TolC family protein [Gemmatimonadaceae bacterium]|nr:TolC family protein [Gemmatimonadaceae bacterium]
MRLQSFALTCAAALSVAVTSSLTAQATPSVAPGGVLTMSDALALARRNNPSLQNSINARRTAAAQVRAANGALLPSVSTSLGGGYREGRQTFFQGQAFGSTNDQLSSDISGQASMNLSLATLNDRKAARSSQNATEADIAAAEQNVRNTVSTQYISALQAQARAALQDTLVATTAVQLQLAQARLQVGSGTQLDVQRAEVANGQQRVAALNQRNQAAIEIVRLFQQIGIEPVANVRLDSNLPAPPALTLPEILTMARKSNPQLDALRAREQAAEFGAKSARSAYFPSLSLSAGLSAFTNRFTNTGLLITQGQASTASSKASCIRSEEVRAAVGLPNGLATCNSIAFTPAQEAAIRESQGKYPFSFTRNPYSLNASLSLPIFNGFRREQQIEQASVQRRNAENDVRGQELRVVADVTAAFLSLTTAQQTVALQEQNVTTARTALALAQERYRVGLASIVDLQQARGDYERAETDRITAVYDVQRAFSTLEAAVGRPLR